MSRATCPSCSQGTRPTWRTSGSSRRQDLQELASKYKSEAFLTSAKTGQNVEPLFKALGKAMADKMASK